MIFFFLQAADSLEMMLLAVLSPVLRCEWELEQIQVALITTVGPVNFLRIMTIFNML